MPTNHVDKIDEILGEFGGRLFGNWDRLPVEEGMVYPVRLQNQAKAQLRAYIADEISKAKMQGFQEGRYAETHPEILTKYE